MKFTATESGFPLPQGNHPASFLGIEEYVNDKQKDEQKAAFGPAVKLLFDPFGEYAGTDCFVVCSQKFTTGSNLFKLAKGMAGNKLKAGDSFDFDDYIGQRFLLTVGPKQKGEGLTVIQITPLPS